MIGMVVYSDPTDVVRHGQGRQHVVKILKVLLSLLN